MRYQLKAVDGLFRNSKHVSLLYLPSYLSTEFIVSWSISLVVIYVIKLLYKLRVRYYNNLCYQTTI